MNVSACVRVSVCVHLCVLRMQKLVFANSTEALCVGPEVVTVESCVLLLL